MKGYQVPNPKRIIGTLNPNLNYKERGGYLSWVIEACCREIRAEFDPLIYGIFEAGLRKLYSKFNFFE